MQSGCDLCFCSCLSKAGDGLVSLVFEIFVCFFKPFRVQDDSSAHRESLPMIIRGEFTFVGICNSQRNLPDQLFFVFDAFV